MHLSNSINCLYYSLIMQNRCLLFILVLITTSSSALSFQFDQEESFWEEIENSYSVKNFTAKDGLPINSVNYISHHSDGFIYMATNDGLARFDGIRFVVFNSFNSPQILSNRIDWVGTSKGEYLWFTDTVDRLYALKNDQVIRLDLNERRVFKIAQFDDQRVLLNTDQGFLIQKKGELKFEQFREEVTKSAMLNSFVLGEEQVFILQEEGIYEFDGVKASVFLSKEELQIEIDSIFNLVKTKNEDLWLLGLNNTLVKISPSGIQKEYLYKTEGEVAFWDLIERTDEQLIISSKKGYLLFDRVTEQFKETDQISASEGYFEDNAWMHYREGLITKFQNAIYIDGKKVLESPKGISFLAVDKESSIWVATNGAGVFQIKKNKLITIGNEIIKGLENVYGLWEGVDGIWLTSFEKNIFKLEENKALNWNNVNSELKYLFFRSVYEDKKGTVWAGNYNLWNFRNGKWEKDDKFNVDQRIDAIFKDSKERFWVGTTEGLFLKDETEYTQFKDIEGRGINSVVSIQEFDEGELLISTSGQGVAILSEGQNVRFLKLTEGLSSNLIRDVYKTSEDTLWVVTEDKGLNRVVHNSDYEIKEVKWVTINDGLVDNSLHRLIDDRKGHFWVNSNKGIMRINEKLLNRYLDGLERTINPEFFGEGDGLLNIEGNGGAQNSGILTKDGKLLFPNQAGLIFTKPEWHIREVEEYFPKPIFEFINYGDSTTSLLGDSQYTLPKGVRSLQVKFTLPYFSKPHNIELEYIIEGTNTQWQSAGVEHTAVFTNLDPGKHTLKVRGHLRGTFKFEEATLGVEIPPYFYETSWFFLLVGISTLGLLILIFRLLLMQSRNREKKLNSLVYTRTQALLIEKERTEEALKQIEELSNARSKFFTNFTHELRTPLTLILNPLEDMLSNEAVISTRRERSLQLMKRNAVRLKELVNRLLDISKLNSDELKFRFQKTDVVFVTSQIAHKFEPEFKRKSISFSIQDFTNEKEVLIDMNAWEHICTNILSNAIKFTPKKGAIELIISEQEKVFVISIKDSGIGIPEHELPFIFDPYFQGDSSISKSGGTGIGLALVKGLIESMYGKITVKSESGEGTIFSIMLKKGADHLHEHEVLSDEDLIEYIYQEGESINALSPSLVNELGMEELHDVKVLLVEDNDDFREYLESVISSKYSVKIAENGLQGLETIESFQPDIIVSDIMMPEMDGYEMMKSIRAIPDFKHIPFIFLSAKDSAADIEKGLNVGADIYLTKPVENNILLTQIKVLLRRERELRKSIIDNSENKKAPLIIKVEEIIQRHLGNPDLNVELIANALAMSSATLYRNWRSISEETLNTTITKCRFEEAIKLIKEENLTISEASYLVGFKQLSYFSRAFKKMYGKSPQEYLNNFKS